MMLAEKKTSNESEYRNFSFRFPCEFIQVMPTYFRVEALTATLAWIIINLVKFFELHARFFFICKNEMTLK